MVRLTLHENGAFQKRFSKTLHKPERFDCLKTKLSKMMASRVFLKHKFKMTVDRACVFKFFRRVVDVNYLTRFHTETSVFKSSDVV